MLYNKANIENTVHIGCWKCPEELEIIFGKVFLVHPVFLSELKPVDYF